MTRILILLLLPALAFGQAIFSGSDVKILKDRLNINGKAIVASGTTDPTSSAVNAPAGSIYLNTSTGRIFRKLDSGSSTNWVAIPKEQSSNIISNPDWDTTSTGWTASGGSYSRTTTASQVYLNSPGAASWDSSTGNQTLTANTFTLTDGYDGINGELYCHFKCASGSCTHKLQVYDGSNAVAEYAITSSTAGFVKTGINFSFPSSGTVAARVVAVAADEPTLYVDNCYLGPATNLREVSQAEVYGTLKISGNTGCSWNGASSASWTSSSAVASCNTPTVTGNATTTGGKIMGVTFASLPPGKYVVESGVTMDGSAADLSCATRLYDGTTGGPAIRSQPVGASGNGPRESHQKAEFIYTTAQGSTTFQVQTYLSSGTGTCQPVANNAASDFFIIVKKYPLTSETTATAETYNWFIDAKIGGSGNIDLNTTDTSTPATPNNANLTLTNETTKGALTTKITCSSTNAPTGTTCSVGNEEPGINFDVPAAGLVQVCFDFTHALDTAGASQIYYKWQVSETASNSQTVVQDCGPGTPGAAADGGDGNRSDLLYPQKVCGLCKFDSSGNKTVRLQHTVEYNGGTINTSQIFATNTTSTGQTYVRVTARPWTQNMPAPVFSGSSSGAAGGSSVKWIAAAGSAPTEEYGVLSGMFTWDFPAASAGSDYLTTFVKVPDSYVAGNPISVRISLFSGGTSNTILLTATSYLLKKDTTAITSTTNSRNTTNTAITNASPANNPREAVLDITDSSGQINSVAVAPGDLIRVKLFRGTDTYTGTISFLPDATEVTFE